MTPECLSREGSPAPEHMLEVSQSAPGSPGNHSLAYPGSGNMIGHQQMTALVGATKARLLLPQRVDGSEQHGQGDIASNGQEHREGTVTYCVIKDFHCAINCSNVAINLHFCCKLQNYLLHYTITGILV